MQLQEEKKQRMKRLNVVSLKMVKEGTFPYRTNVIRSPKDVFDLASEFIGYCDREHAILICLSTKNTVLALETVAIGSLSAALMHPREIFKTAIVCNSASIILAHSHPSFDPTPSFEDLQITQKIKECGELLSIALLDHVIVGGDNHHSMKEHGQI